MYLLESKNIQNVGVVITLYRLLKALCFTSVILPYGLFYVSYNSCITVAQRLYNCYIVV